MNFSKIQTPKRCHPHEGIWNEQELREILSVSIVHCTYSSEATSQSNLRCRCEYRGDEQCNSESFNRGAINVLDQMPYLGEVSRAL